MSVISFLGAIEIGLLYGLVAFGIYLSFRILRFPDLTVDGSFPLGAAVSASLIVVGVNPFLATFFAFIAGALAGALTAFLSVRLKILNLLSSILVMIALYSINLRIMGRPNIALLNDITIFTYFENDFLSNIYLYPILFFIIVLFFFIALKFFLTSQIGLAMRAAGQNEKMSSAQGVNVGIMVVLGLALSNALVALSGSLMAQSQGIADITSGVGVIVIGLASVIGGESLVTPKNIFRALMACIVGSILYRFAIVVALNVDFLGFNAQDLNLITAILVTVAIVIPNFKTKRKKSV
jgi:putative ABC transport system permease protein